MSPNTQKPPRQWAAEVAALPTLAQRRAHLARVPEHLRPLVQAHVKITWDRKNNNAAK